MYILKFVKMFGVAGCHNWKCKFVYTGFGIVLYAAVMLLRYFRC